MRRWLTAVLAVVVVMVVVTHALPVKEKKPTSEEEKAADKAHKGDGSDDWELSLEYGRYLREVVQALESDQAFRKKLETADVNDIKSGKIARELHFVDHNVRTKLDELKRRELERLRHLAIKEHEKENGVDRRLLKVPVHIDHRNPTRFEVEDLKKLIIKTTEDLEKVDQERRTEFKNYEMDKEYSRQQELLQMDETHRKVAEEKHQKELMQHKQHEKLHHPGSKKQLEEVWEEQDHMQPEDFDPKTFFHLHDLDGNGYWDQMEVKALFKKELDKMYDPNAPEDDLTERYEEMERMREHVFRESDTDKDNLISFKEFVDQTKRADFEQDNGWQGLDEQEMYSQQEYEEYERQRQEEIRKLVESGAAQAQGAQQGHLQAGQVTQGQAQTSQGHPAQIQANELHPAQVQQGQQVQVQPPQAANVEQGQLAQGLQGQPGQGQGVQGQHLEVKASVAGQVPQPPQPGAAGQVGAGQPLQPGAGQVGAVHH